MKDFEQITREELILEILRVVEYICRTNKDGYPCLLRKNYNTYLPYLNDIESVIREMLGTLITAKPTKKGFEDIKLTEKGKMLLHPSRESNVQDVLSGV